MIKSYVFLIFCVLFNSASQVVFAWVAKDISFEVLTLSNVKLLSVHLFNNWFFWIALTSFGLSALFWILGIKRIALAKAFSITSLNFILIFFYSFFILNEEISILKIIACLSIVSGVVILSNAKNIKVYS